MWCFSSDFPHITNLWRRKKIFFLNFISLLQPGWKHHSASLGSFHETLIRADESSFLCSVLTRLGTKPLHAVFAQDQIMKQQQQQQHHETPRARDVTKPLERVTSWNLLERVTWRRSRRTSWNVTIQTRLKLRPTSVLIGVLSSKSLQGHVFVRYLAIAIAIFWFSSVQSFKTGSASVPVSK